jgi:hypothetical protein
LKEKKIKKIQNFVRNRPLDGSLIQPVSDYATMAPLQVQSIIEYYNLLLHNCDSLDLL